MKKEQNHKLLLSFLYSILLNALLSLYVIYHSLSKPGWGIEAMAEAEAAAAIACSWHGHAFVDSVVVNGRPKCECNNCYAGEDCSILMRDCSADAVSGDPQYLEPYWRQNAGRSAVVLSGWHRMSYQNNAPNYISMELERHIRLLHRAVGNAVTDDRFIIFGSGSTQLLNAVIKAFSSPLDHNSPVGVVATAPYYEVFREQTKLFNSREYQWKGIPSNMSSSTNSTQLLSENLIEIVTSPNNPDGNLQRRSKFLLGSSMAAIHDHAYYWPQYSPIPAPADEDVMLFSNAKFTGHASSRFGWAIIKDEKVYQKVVTYMDLSTVGVSSDTQLRVLKLIKTILLQIREEGDFFKFGYETMKERWQRLSKVVSSSNRFSLQKLSPHYCSYFNEFKDPSPAYAWLRCEKDEDEDCEAVLRNAGILSRGGTMFEAHSRYARLSLIKTLDDFEQLLQKLQTLIFSTDSYSSL
ncbi:hypothetical protein KFK09_008219 [Dendrobium nobile]|uniref:Uncharacterized protein n=1 Tax=Dendrobium nobile TaxID=94219 RepID=A0A8T3BJN7_DENNO|nr:hypothetical protein KFK09_008219 [Dendrobium nobile]